MNTEKEGAGRRLFCGRTDLCYTRVMKILEIYERYHIPINLQDHMLRTAAVGNIVCDSLKNVTFDREKIVTELLLHDMGNILKFKFERMELFAPEDQDRVEEMRAIQSLFRQKYGETPDEATVAIVTELGLGRGIIELLQRCSIQQSGEIAESGSWEEKICVYSDMRVGPYSILPMEERFADLLVRYRQHQDGIKRNLLHMRRIESQLQEKSRRDLQAIDDDLVEPTIAELRQMGIG